MHQKIKYILVEGAD